MNWQDKGYLISNNKYNENSSIAEFYTENYGKTSGIIFGSSSKKVKNYLLIGNKFHINFNSKNESKIGNFKVEIEKINTPFFFEDEIKLNCIIYAMNLIKLITVENQKNKNIYDNIHNFFIFLNNDEWIKKFIFWELEILKNIGFDINFENYVSTQIVNGNEVYVSNSSFNKKIVPNFLINKKINNIEPNQLILGLNLVGDFLDKTILKPNNINFPISRKKFVNLID
tara:strand:- start:646 stop:1326 length:681 start_codon:yes stop_codon:yes gene_type:complete